MRSSRPAGYKVEVYPFESPTEGKNAVVTKSVDFGMFGIAAATLGAAAGEPLVVIASACNKGMAVIAAKDAPIASIKDLKGKRVGIWPGSTQEVFIFERLRMEGMSVADIKPVRIFFSEMHLALANGDIDAYVGAEPGPSVSLASGIGKLVEYPYGTTMGALNMVFGTHRDVLSSKPALAKVMLEIHRKGVRARHEAPRRIGGDGGGKARTKEGGDRGLVAECGTDLEVRADGNSAGQDLRPAHARAQADQATSGLRHVLRHQHRRGDGEAGLSVSLETTQSSLTTPPERATAAQAGVALLARLRNPALAVLFPVLVLVGWHFATYGRKFSLIPPPTDVALALYDLAFGGINDDAYSRTLHVHLLASLGRVYGGFAIAFAIALPLGLLIGRIPLVRRLLDPTLQVLRPIPVTAWLPLAMIMFGLGPRSAFFLVCLGAFYPILINTIFGVRASISGCSKPPACWAARARRSFFGWSCRRACPRFSPGCGSAWVSPGW